MRSHKSLRPIVKSIGELKDAIDSQKRFEVVRYCTDRFEEIERQRREAGDWDNTVLYYQAYWLLQLQQFHFFKCGWVEPYIFKFWLKGKYLGFHMHEIVTNDIKRYREKASYSNIEDEMGKAQNQQDDFQRGWNWAERYLASEIEFIELMTKVMKAKTPAQSDEAIDTVLKKYADMYPENANDIR